MPSGLTKEAREITYEGVYRKDDRIYCKKDYLQAHGHQCPTCHEVIVADMVIALGRRWHEDHFICAGACKRSIKDMPYFTLQADQARQLALLRKLSKLVSINRVVDRLRELMSLRRRRSTSSRAHRRLLHRPRQ